MANIIKLTSSQPWDQASKRINDNFTSIQAELAGLPTLRELIDLNARKTIQRISVSIKDFNNRLDHFTITDSMITDSEISWSVIMDSILKDNLIVGGNIDGSTLTNIPFAGIENAEIEVAKIADAQIKKAEIERLDAKYAKVKDLEADYATIEHLEANYAHVNDLKADYAKIDFANVNNAWIQNGVIKNGAIGDAQIIGVSANKLTAGTIDAGKITVTNLNATNITAGFINGQRIGNGSIDLEKLAEEVPTKEQLDEKAKELQNQIDGAIETWTVSTVPLLVNKPAVDWTTDEERAKHVGDVAYVVNAADATDGYCYRFCYDDTSRQFMWTLIKDNQITAALKQVSDLGGTVTKFKEDYGHFVDETSQSLDDVFNKHSEFEDSLGHKISSDTFNQFVRDADSTYLGIKKFETFQEGYNTRITNCESAIKETEDSITLTSKKVDNLQIGGRNIIKNSDFRNDLREWVPENTSAEVKTDDTVGKFVSISPKVVNATYARIYQNVVNVWKQETYAYSFYAKSSRAGSRIVASRSIGNFGTYHTLTTEWKLYSGTITSTAEVEGGTLSISALVANVGDTVQVTKIKLEKGSKPTDWTPAPEDVQGGIDALEGRVSTAESAIKQTADNITLTVKNKVDAAVAKTVKTVDAEYYLSTSATSLAGGSWQTTAPAWVNGRYMWSRTKTTYQNGTSSYTPSENGTCIAGATGAAGAAGATGTGIASIVEEYYLSTSKTSQTGGSWSTTAPTWSAGKYVWTRSKITYKNPASTAYTTPACSSEWEAVNELQVGGRNLLKGTSSEEREATTPTTASTTWGSGFAIPKTPDVAAAIPFGSAYRASVDVFLPVDGTFSIDVNNQYATGTASTSNDNDNISKRTATRIDVKANTWTRISWGSENTNQSNTDKRDLIVYDSCGLLPQSSDVTWSYKCLKVELGNKATDWTPAPEDILEEIEAAQADIKIYADQIDSIVQSGTQSSLMKQTTNGFEFNFVDGPLGAMREDIDEVAKNTAGISMGKVGSSPYIDIKAEENKSKVRITSTSVDFMDGENKVAYVANDAMNIDKAIIDDELVVGGFSWQKGGDGSMGLIWVGI